MNLPIPFVPLVVGASFKTIMSWGRAGLKQALGAPVELRPNNVEDWERSEWMVGGWF